MDPDHDLMQKVWIQIEQFDTVPGAGIPKQIFEKSWFWKESAEDKKAWNTTQNPRMQRV